MLFSLWNMASPTTKCYRLTFAIGLLLDKYYQCEPTEQWPTVSSMHLHSVEQHHTERLSCVLGGQ